MALPIFNYAPVSQNHRVANYEIPGDEQPRSSAANQPKMDENYDELIPAIYRQVLNEQQLLTCNRQPNLESQLRNKQITVQQFIRGLLLSDAFTIRNYDCNNNYRVVQICVQRLLGREVYSEQEKYAWSTVLATQGLAGFVDALLDSDEYQANFGNSVVPYQRRRILPQRDRGDVTFAHTPRYDADHLAQLEALGYFQNKAEIIDFSLKPWQMKAAEVIVKTGITVLVLFFITIALAAWGVISL